MLSVPGPSKVCNKAELVPSPLWLLLMLLLYHQQQDHHPIPEPIPDLGSLACEMGILGTEKSANGSGSGPCRRDKECCLPSCGSLRPSLQSEARRSSENASPREQPCQKAIHNSLPNGASGGVCRGLALRLALC